VYRNFQNVSTDGETSLKSVSIWRLVCCLLSILSINPYPANVENMVSS